MPKPKQKTILDSNGEFAKLPEPDENGNRMNFIEAITNVPFDGASDEEIQEVVRDKLMQHCEDVASPKPHELGMAISKIFKHFNIDQSVTVRNFIEDEDGTIKCQNIAVHGDDIGVIS